MDPSLQFQLKHGNGSQAGCPQELLVGADSCKNTQQGKKKVP